jgi:hypothetical protein
MCRALVLSLLILIPSFSYAEQAAYPTSYVAQQETDEGDEEAVTTTKVEVTKNEPFFTKKKIYIISGVVVTTLVAGVIYYFYYLNPGQPQGGKGYGQGLASVLPPIVINVPLGEGEGKGHFKRLESDGEIVYNNVPVLKLSEEHKETIELTQDNAGSAVQVPVGSDVQIETVTSPKSGRKKYTLTSNPVANRIKRAVSGEKK